MPPQRPRWQQRSPQKPARHGGVGMVAGSSMAKFVVTSILGRGRECGPRCGRLESGGASVFTPTMLVNTIRGCVPNTTPDLFADVGTTGHRALALCATHFLASPGLADLTALNAVGKDGRTFLGLSGSRDLIFVVPHDIINPESSPRRLPGRPSAGLTAGTVAGTVPVDASVYAVVARWLRPDVLCTLHEHVSPELRADKRLAATREGLAMASECVRALAAEDVSTSFLMPLSGAEDPESQRVCLEGGRKCKAEMESLGAHVLGYSVISEGDRATRDRGVGTVLAGVGDEAGLRLVSCEGDPGEVIRMVEAGADLLYLSHVTRATSQGRAFTFDPVMPESWREAGVAEGGQDRDDVRASSQDGSADVWGGTLDVTKVAADDSAPISSKCQCLACRTASRAYVSHLLANREMLGDTLLEIHNTHHYLEFFSHLRQAIASGTLSQYRDWIASQVTPAPAEGSNSTS